MQEGERERGERMVKRGREEGREGERETGKGGSNEVRE